MLFAIAGTGNAILFVCSLAALAMIAAYTLSFAAHCYLVVAQGTAAGIDRVQWPDEPIVDWLFQAVHLGAILLIWLVPAGILSRALSSDVLPGDGALRLLLIAGPGLWLIVPLGLLSALSSSSRWALLSPRVVVSLLCLFPSTVLFYLSTGVLLAAGAALAYIGVFTQAWYTLPVAAVGGSAVLLIHARLLGRIAWLIGQRDPGSAPSRKKKKAGPGPHPRKKATRPPRPTASHDPWAATEEEPAGERMGAPGVPGYRVVEREVVECPPPRPSYLDPEPEPYTVAGAEAEEPPGPPTEYVTPDPAQVERELQLRTHEPPNPPPALPLFSGVYTFPVYETTLKAWVWLVVWGAGTAAVLRVVVTSYPY